MSDHSTDAKQRAERGPDFAEDLETVDGGLENATDKSGCRANVSKLLFLFLFHISGAVCGAIIGQYLFGQGSTENIFLGAVMVITFFGWFVNTLGLLVALDFLPVVQTGVAFAGLAGTLVAVIGYWLKRNRLWATAVMFFSALWSVNTLIVWEILMSV